MKKFEIKKNIIEVPAGTSYYPGITIAADWQDPELIACFDTLDEALKELEKYKSHCSMHSGGCIKYMQITEYYIEQNQYDNNGEWEGCCICSFAPLTD